MRKGLRRIVAIVCVFTMAFSIGKVDGLWKNNVEGAEHTALVSKDNCLILGKTFFKDGVLTFSYANSGLEIHFEGSSISGEFVVGQDENAPQSIAVFVDGNEEPEDATLIELTAAGEYVLAEGLEYGEHTITIRKMNRSYYGFLAAATVGIKNVTTDGVILDKPAEKELTIEVFGDSITNGDATYQDEHYTSASFSWMGYVGEVARYFDADLKSCGISGQGLLRSILADENGKYFNLFPPANNWAKLDESATTESYDHMANPADVVIINLGTNDNAAFSSGQITSEDFYTEYLRFINEIHTDCPNAIVVAALGAMGAEGLFPAIKQAVSTANSQAGETYAYFTQLANCNTITNGVGYDNSHPSQVAHKIYGQQLCELIEGALLDKGVLDESNYQKADVTSAKHSSVDDFSHTASCAVDNNTVTRWASLNNGCSEWIELELDQTYEVNKIYLSWETAYAEKYRILTSLDGVNWTVDTEVNNGNGYNETKRLSGAKAKYIRVECVERGTIHAYSLYEVGVYGKAVGALQKPKLVSENVVGEMFMPVSVTPAEADVLIDNSGMSGLEAPNHMHASFDSNDTTSNSIITDNMYLGDKSSIIIDLGQIQSLGEMYFWNYNDIRNLDSGMKNIIVDYSEDGITYTRAGMYLLGQSSMSDNNKYGGNVAVSVGDDKSVDFNGAPGRYVRITPYDNYGGSGYGLSEIRIFRHKTEPVSGDSLTVDVFAPEQLDNITTINAFNNTGLSIIDGTYAEDEHHSNDSADMAVLQGNSTESMMILNLDGNYPMSTMKIWNYNSPDNLGIGIKEFEVWYTVGTPCAIITHSTEEINAGAKDYIDFGQGDWKKLGNYTLPQGTGKDGISAQLEIDMSGIRAQHIKLVPISNYNGANNIFGLSEVKVYVAKGWATEYSREWTGVLSSSGTFAYQGNTAADNKGSSLLNTNNGRGWIGGDGFYTTSLNGSQLQGSINDNSKTIFTFQDSFEGNFGNYDGFGYEHGYGTSDNSGFSIGMRNQAYMMLEGDEPDVRNIRMYMQLENGISDSAGYGGNIYPGKYWLGDSTVVNGNLYTVANRFEGLTIPDADFYKSPLESSGFPSMTAIPQLVAKDITANTEAVYHETIYEEGDYLYVYGKKDNLLVVSRIRASDYESLMGFEYWNGNEWVSNADEAAAISSFMPGNEFNITKITEGTFAGKYMLVHTTFSITGAVSYAIADSPVGPFVEQSDSQLYWSTEKYKVHMRYYSDKPVIFQQWNYNAKSQPAISQAGELLITYHFGIHDDQEKRVPVWGYFSAVEKEAEHPTFIKLFDIKQNEVVLDEPSDVNLALGKAVTTSSYEANERNASMAVDGNSGTRWASTAEDPSWITIDLGNTMDVCKVVLKWEAAYGAKYRIEVSQDGNTWERAYAETASDGGMDEIHFATMSARYIRMYGIQRGTVFGYSLYEFEVYGPKSSEIMEPEEQTTEKVTTEEAATGESTTEETVTEDITTKEESGENNVKIEVNGYQISTTVEGYRVIYSLSDTDSQVDSLGLIWGLADYTDEADMIVGSTSNTVYSYLATEAGRTSVSYSDAEEAKSYAMTMKFIKSKEFYNAGIRIRAYARLKNGKIVYSKVYDTSIYKAADVLYRKQKMTTKEAHNYLYDNILTVVNNGYEWVDYDWNNTIVKPN